MTCAGTAVADEGATVLAAARQGIAIDGLASSHRARAPEHPSLVLGFGNVAEPAIARGILAQTLGERQRPR